MRGERAFLTAVGGVNRLVFWATRGRVIPYPFSGMTGLMLGVDGEPVMVGVVRDGDDFIVMAEASEQLDLRSVPLARADLNGRPFDVSIEMLADGERGAVRERVLGLCSRHERHMVLRHDQHPVARVMPHELPVPDGSTAFSGIS